MRAINLLDALGKAKFKPFNLCLDKGEIVRVKHPECVLVNESKTVAAVAKDEHFHIVDLDCVSTLTL